MNPPAFRPLRARAGALCLAATLGLAANVHAQGVAGAAAPKPNQLPTGGQVVAGQAQITQNAAAMTVQQNTLRAVIDWQQFNLGSQAQIRFAQPSAAAVTLNRVVGADPSQIMGRISAPGQVFISNPQGVLFGAGASVDVGGLVATTMGIGNAEFMAGQNRFDRNGATAGVVNQGRLTADAQGYIALLAPEVRNEGVITAQAGSAVLAAGEAITLNFGTPGRLDSITVTPAQIATLVENRRAVLVEGGQIIIAARSAEQLMGSVVNSGELSATSLVRRGGKIVLEGDDIHLADGSRIEARGTADAAAGGGTVLIGGDWQGGGAQHQATRVTMDSGASVDASAIRRGDGGTVVLWSDVNQDAGQTVAGGTIVARGGAEGGDGGRVETSGHAVAVDGLRVDAGAPVGKAGLWLIDPYDYAINAAAATAIGSALNTSDVTVTTTVSNPGYGGSAVNTGAGDISVDSTITKTGSGTSTLTLQAGRRVRGVSDVTTTDGPLNVVLWAGYAGSGGGVQVNNITTRGGSVWVGGSSGAAGSGTWNGLTVGNGPATGIVSSNANGVDWYGTIDTRAASGGAGGDLLLWSGNGVSGGVGLANQSAARVLAGAGNATLRADTYTWSTNPVITGTGTFTFEPSGTSFGQSMTNASFNLSGATPGGVVFGKDGNTSQVTIDNAMTVAGPIRLYGGNVTLNANLTSTLAGAAILAKGSGAIVSNANRTLQTNGGAITLWSDSDANGGYIWLNQNATLDSRTVVDRVFGSNTTGGGKITLAGGADNGSGAPGGYALGDGGNTDRGGINFGDQTASGHSSNTQILSGGGDVLLRGKSSNGLMGINWVDSGTLNAGSTGIVSLEGINTVSGHGIEFAAFGGSGNSTTIRSGGGSGSTPAITFTGSGTGSGFNGIQSGRPLTVLATGAGGITVNGTATSGWGYTGPLDFLAASGAIAISGGSGGIASSSGGTLGRKAASAVTASSSNVTLSGGNFSIAGATTIDTTGAVTIQPAGTSFTSAQTFSSSLSVASGASALTFGKPGNTIDVTIGAAQTIAGPIGVYGGNIMLNGDLTSTLAGAPILAKASSAIITGNNRTLQTNGGAITLWSDSDASGQGFILLNQNATLDSRTAADRLASSNTTGGGKITLAGGADDGTGAPGGYAISTSSTSDRGGINFGDQTVNGHNNTTQILSGGGNVALRGSSGSGTMGINWVDSGSVNAGSTGLISLNGVNSSTGHGIEFGAYAVNGSSIVLRSGGGTSGTPAISISGTGGSNGNGVQATRLTGLATGAGGISISGSTANASGYGYTGPLDFLAASGPIGIDGGSRGINSNGGTLGRKAATSVTASSSNVALTGGTLNIASATTIDTTGTVTLQPSGTSFSSAQTLGSSLTLTGGVSGLTFGKPGNTADLAVSSAQSIAGPISLYGGTITINSPITETSNADSTLLMQAVGDIVVNGSSITSSNAKLNLVFISDWDSNNGGAIYVNGGTTPVTFNTRGGAVWLGGDGYAPAYSTTTWNGLTVGTGAATSFGTNYVQEGVNLKATTITTSGGDVYVAGTNNRYNSNENRYGVILQQGTAINTGSGNISLVGTLAQQTGTLSTYPVLFGTVLDTASLQTSTGNISITGGEAATSGSMNAGGYGVRLLNSTVRTTGATGDINLAGTLGTNPGSGATVDGVQLQAYGASASTVVATVGGNIAITGTANTTNSAASNGIELLTGQPTNTNSSNPVVQVVSRTGNVSLTGDNPVNTNTGSTGVVLNGVNYGKIAVGYDGTNAYSGNTVVTGRSVVQTNTYSGYLTLGGSGALTIQPTGNSFVSGTATGQSLDFNSYWALGNNHNAITLGKDAGTASKADTITVSNALAAAGPISVYGGDILLNANLASTPAGAGLLAKASGSITTAASTAFQTNNGNLTFWSDSDASGAGAITIGNSNTFNSAAGATGQQTGGGKVTLAGGADTNADGIPDGPAGSSSGNGLAFGTSYASSTTVVSGGGDVLFRGRTSATGGVYHGVVATGALSVDSGQGAIAVTGDSAASYGVEFSNYASGTALTLNSAKTSGTAIAITGTTTASGAHGVVFDNDAVENLLATGGGAIAISGTASTGVGVWLQNTNVLASSGAITIDGGTGGIRVASGAAGSTIGKSTSGITSSSSNVTLSGDSLNFLAPITVDTIGTVTLRPSSASFGSAQTLGSNATIASGASGLTFGKPGNTAGLTVTNARSIAGPISVYGGNVGISTTLNATAAGDILVRASGTLTMSAGSALQAANGNVTATAARWVNQSGASALVAGGSGHQWQVWSSNAAPFDVGTGDVRGGLAFDYKQYGATYGASTVLGTGNGLLYSYQPTVTASLAGSVAKVYDGGTAATLTSGNLVVGSGVDGDQSLVAGTPASIVFATRNVGSGLNVTASGLAVASATSSSATGSKPVYGYALTSSSASGAIGSITPKALTATVAAPSRAYDGTTVATPTLTIASGLVGSETLGATGIASFDSKDVATASLVTVTGTTLSNGTNGGLAGNYSLAAGQTVAAGITRKALTASVAAPNKVYDGTTSATPALTLTSGLVGSETLGVGGTASFDTRDVATAGLVTVTATTLADGTNGGLAGNYSLAAGETVAAAITPKALTATVAAPSKVYDGTTAAAPTLTIASGLLGSETVGAGGSASFDTKDVATASLVTVTATTLADGTNGGLASNYSLAAGQTVASTITPKALTAAVSAASKAYDGNTTASPALTIASGLVGSESLGVTGTGSFNSKDVDAANLVTVAGTTLSNGSNGGLASNYGLAAGQTVAATITPKALTATVAAPDKVYDGSTSATPTLTIASGLVGSETLGVGGTASFNSKDAGAANLVTVTATTLANGANGGLAGNYSLANGETVAASITRRPLTAGVAAPGKVYDGDTSASPTLTIVSGLVGNETLGVSGTGNFNSKDVATANLVTVTGTTLADGANGGLAGNYSLANGSTVASSITPKALTATVAAPGKVYDGTTAASPTLTIASGLVGSETLGVAGIGSFDSKDVATANLVTVASTTLADGRNGGLAGNYSLAAGQTVAAGITPKPLTATVAAPDKAYDGSTIAAPTLTIASGLVGSETLGVGGTASFNSKDVATAGLVTVTGTTLADGGNGGVAGNYALGAGQTVAAQITPRGLTASVVAPGKVYDGDTSASPTLTIVSGLVGNETLGVSGTGNFNSKDVATANLVTVTGTTLADGANGGLAGNYSLANGATVASSITPKALTATVAASGKVYDGTIAASPTLTIASGLVGGETLGVAGTAAFNSKDVATANVVTVTSTTLADGSHGGLAGNYALAAGQTVAAGITPLAVAVTGVTANDKAYDAGTLATLGGSARVAVLSGDSANLDGAVLASFADKNVGSGKAVGVTGYTLVGGDAGNYTLLQPTGLRAAITPATLQIAGLTALDKVYDATTAANVGGTATVAALGADQLALAGSASASFADRNVGSARSVAVVGYTLTGADAANYLLVSPAGLTASITPATLSLAGARVYDGSTSIAGSQLGASGVAGESFVVTGGGAAGNLVSRNVQAGQPLASADGLALGAGSNGALAGNYLPLAQATSHIDVTARPLTLGAAPVTKVYDGTTVADTSAAVIAGSLAAGDRPSGGQFAYADPNAGSAKVVTASQVTIDDGNRGLNYSVAYAANQAVGRITPAPLTVTANDDAKFVTRADSAGYNGVHYSGFVNGETAALLGGNATVTRVGSVETAGLQPGVLAPSGLSAANYDIRYANGSFTIVPASQLLVRVANQNTTYGDAAAPGYTVLSAQYLDGANVIRTLTPSTQVAGNLQRFSDGAGGQAAFTLGPLAGATSGAGLLKAGSYAVAASNVTETSVNFSNTLTVVGQLTVDPRAVRPVLAGGPSKVYDGSTSIGPLQLSLPGAIGGDQLQTDGVGTFGSRNAGTRLGYTVDRVTLGGADAGNYVLLGGGNFSGSDGVITPKPVTLTAPAVSKVYDGQTGYGASAADLATLSAQLGVTGDAVRSVQVGFVDKNVGTGKGVVVSGPVVDDGNGGANYVLTLVGSNSGAITRLGSVAWTGGATGSWFDPANWAGGAVPDLRNVATVVIPAGVSVAFDDAVAPAPARGPVFVDAIGSAGALQMRGGELDVGPGGLRLADLSQSGGRLNVQGDVALRTFAQIAGASTVAGSFSATQGYMQSTQGTLAVQGRVDITAPLGDVVLGTLRAAGGLDVTTSGGSIRQATGTALTVPGATVLDAGSGDIALGNDGNDFLGAFSARGHQVTLRDASALTLGTVTTSGDLSLASNGRLDPGHSTVGGVLIAVSQGGDIVQQGPLAVRGTSDLDATAGASHPAGTAAGDIRLDNDANDFVGAVSARGNDVTLRDGNALALGTVSTTGNLSLVSHGALDLGTSTVGGALTAVSRGGDIFQQGPLVVHGASDLNAGAGAVRLVDPSNALAGPVVATASTTRITGRTTNDTQTWLPPIIPSFVAPTPAAAPALDRAMSLELHVAMMWLDPHSQRFAYTLPTEIIERVRRSGAVPVVLRADGRPLPEWLHFDAGTMSLSAEQMPDGQLPMSLALWTAGERLLIRVASAAP